MRKTGKVRFVEFVNRNIGKPLTTIGISKKTEVHLRRVQLFCKAIRGKKTVGTVRSNRSYVYTINKPLNVRDIR